MKEMKRKEKRGEMKYWGRKQVKSCVRVRNGFLYSIPHTSKKTNQWDGQREAKGSRGYQEWGKGEKREKEPNGLANRQIFHLGRTKPQVAQEGKKKAKQ